MSESAIATGPVITDRPVGSRWIYVTRGPLGLTQYNGLEVSVHINDLAWRDHVIVRCGSVYWYAHVAELVPMAPDGRRLPRILRFRRAC